MELTIMNDSIHGHMTFHPLLKAIIDTPQFQRLRNIKQLGMAYHVYPSACHNRFEHSLGTCWLTGKLLQALNKIRGTSDNEKLDREKEILCVQIAGLCHDLGHGPFSHLWERFLHEKGINWKHEENSIKTLDMILEEDIIRKPDCHENGNRYIKGNLKIKDLFHKFGLKNEEIQLVKDLILGKPSGSALSNNRYLYQIICNKDNDIDVDKFDYISRDSKMLNLPVHFDMVRIMESCQILEVDGIKQICFRDKVCCNIADMFMARGVLHDKTYQHPRVKIIEEMLIDALLLADHKYDFSSIDPNDISKLTDHVFQKLLYEDCGNDEKLMRAQHLLTRIYQRKLYSVVETVQIKTDENINQTNLEKIAEEIWKNFSQYINIQKGNIGILLIQINIGNSNKNKPLENVYVFGKESRKTAEKFDWADGTTALMPNLKNFLKRELIILYKGENEEILNQLKKGRNSIGKIATDKGITN